MPPCFSCLTFILCREYKSQALFLLWRCSMNLVAAVALGLILAGSGFAVGLAERLRSPAPALTTSNLLMMVGDPPKLPPNGTAHLPHFAVTPVVLGEHALIQVVCLRCGWYCYLSRGQYCSGLIQIVRTAHER